MPERLSLDCLRNELRTAQFGRAARIVAEATSTIDLAWAWLKGEGPEGGVVIAARQTRGRGRLGRQWFSPPGGLWMSVVTRPRVRAAAAGRLGAGMAVAAAEGTGEAAHTRVGLKWPNDLVIGGRKVGGVLVETEARGELIDAAVLSLGLNVNLPADVFDEDMRASATSLLQATGREHSLEAIAARVLERLECLWPSITMIGTELPERWAKLDCVRGLEVTVSTAEGTLTGLAAGIGLGGDLVLMVDGEAKTVGVGEVRLVRNWVR